MDTPLSATGHWSAAALPQGTVSRAFQHEFRKLPWKDIIENQKTNLAEGSSQAG